MFERGRALARHELGDLARPEVADLDLSAHDIDTGARGVHGHAELCALDHGGEIGGLDLEMFDVALLDLKQDRAGPLDDRGRQCFLLFGGQPDHRIRRNQDAFLSARQEYAAIAARAYGIAWLEIVLGLKRRLLHVSVCDPDLAGRFADRPCAALSGECPRCSRKCKYRCDQTQKHAGHPDNPFVRTRRPQGIRQKIQY